MTACDDCLRRTGPDRRHRRPPPGGVQAANCARPRAGAAGRDAARARGRWPCGGATRASRRAATRARASDAGLAVSAAAAPTTPSACATSPTRPRCCTFWATPARWRRRRDRRGRRAPGLDLRARDRALARPRASRRRASPSSPDSRSGSTRQPTPARSRPRHDRGRAGGERARPLSGARLAATRGGRRARRGDLRAASGREPHRWCFIARNRIIAALGAATVVVQATERSGSLTTADFAAELGRAVGAVPGAVTSRLSAGTHALIQAGAPLIGDAADALELLGGRPVRVPDRAAPPVALAPPLPRCSTRSRTVTARSPSSPRRRSRLARRWPAWGSSSGSGSCAAASPAAGSGRRERRAARPARGGGIR